MIRMDRDVTDLGLPVLPADDGPALPHRCVAGWAGEDRDGRPVPCQVCRPHLQRELDPRTGVTAWRPRRRREDG